MRAVVIENGVVKNAIKVDSIEFAEQQGWIVSNSAKVGQLYSNGAFVDPSPTLEQLSVLREQRRKLLQTERETAIAQPVNNIQVGRQEDRENIEGTIERWDTLLGAPISIEWTLADNTVRKVTKHDLQQVSDAYVLRRWQMHQAYQQALKALNAIDLNAPTAKADIEAVTLTT